MAKSVSFSIYGVIIGAVVGVIFGAIVGSGESNYYKKSHRDTTAPMLVIGLGAVGTITGGIVGYRIGRTIGIEEETGIANSSDNFYKVGRYWSGVTEWTDPRDGQQHTIDTKRVYQGMIQSSLNDKPIATHDTRSASQVSINKCHREARNFVFSRIKEAYKSDQSAPINDLF